MTRSDDRLWAMEELEDIEAFDKAISSDEPFIPWEKLKKEIIDKD